MSTGASKDNQFATPGDGDTSGGNSSGGTSLKMPQTRIAPDFMGRSGQPDNQDTDRPKGST